MKQADAIALLSKGIKASHPQHWADLGCGSGTFTKALTELLPAGSRIDAVDQRMQRLALPVNFICANFETDDLPLTQLDGILMANALHFVKDKLKLIQKLETYFSSVKKFLIVEYDTGDANPWVPYPIPYSLLNDLFSGLGYQQIIKLASRPSIYNRATIYAALAQKT